MMRDRTKCSYRRSAIDDHGYVMPLLALTLSSLIFFAALAVDVGGWYVRGSQLQRGADAAALAGVVWMPDFNKAKAVALDTATRNGFTTGASIAVSVSPVAGNMRQLRVSITDSQAPQYLSKLFLSSESITRTATAEYVLPVPLGSPKNTFGSGDLRMPGTTTRENFWAAVNGYCAGHESGDLRLARYESYSVSSSGSSECNNGSPTVANAPGGDYDPNGYLYAVELPTAASRLILQAYDAGYNNSGSTPDLALVNRDQSVTTTFKIYDRDNTPLDTSDNPLLQTITISPDDPTFANGWQTLHSWTAPAPGTYYVRVLTASSDTTESRASNGFALRAYTGNTFSTCTTDRTDVFTAYSPSCPQIHGVTDMSIFANLGGSAGSTASFYLAQIQAIHAGKTMTVQLFDSGEGARRIELLDPNGIPAIFTWSTDCTNYTPPAGGCSGRGVFLDVSGTGPGPFSGFSLNSNSKYNDRKMLLSVQLPSNYSTIYGTRDWWKIRYTLGGNPTDRTTWSVSIVGDPVHLVG